MQENIGVESNVNSEMSDLVHLAEEWASAQTGFNRVPEVSVRELRTHKIGKHIVTRAALRLLEQLGIKSVDDYTKHFGRFENESKEKEEEKERVISPVSPMTVDEFQSILKSGWPIDEPLPSSPFGSRRRTSMLADLIPLSPIASEARDVSPSPPNKFAIPKLAKRKSEPATATATANRKLFATTPRDKETFSFRKSMPDTPNQRKGDMPVQMQMIMTPKRAATMDRRSPPPSQNETPYENRASRLRRMKLEENKRIEGKGGNNRASMNSSFGCQ